MSHLISNPASRSLVRLLSLASKPCGRSLCTPETRTQKLERITDELIDLNKQERYDFTILWRLKMGLNRYGPAVTGLRSSGPAASGAAEAKAAEKTALDIKLEKYDATAKIKIIKEVRAVTDLGLKEAKDLVEKVPCVLKKGLTKEEAESIIQKLRVGGYCNARVIEWFLFS